MDVPTLRKSYTILDSVLRGGAYLNIELNSLKDDNDKNTVVKIVYGTLENYYECAYVLDALVLRPPKAKFRALFLQAIYALRHLDAAKYAVVNASVELSAKIGGAEIKGFVNAVLKRVAKGEPEEMPDPASEKGREIALNAPSWLIDKLESEGYDAENALRARSNKRKHVRLSAKCREGETALGEEAGAERSESGGYFVAVTPRVTALIGEGKATFQSPSSMEAVLAFGDVCGKSFLDLCAAPGGKAVFAAERGASVTACDVHPHRTELIRAYAERIGVDLKAEVNDGTVYRRDFDSRFDCVLIDAPCSGLGILSSRPDIVLNRQPSDFRSLAEVQSKLLLTGSRYVRKGGLLVYSTCTLSRAENEGQINKFLKINGEFRIEGYGIVPEGMRTILPDDRMDGFFIARLRRQP